MEEQFIPYEQALKLKELGFSEPCFGYYTGDKRHLVIRPSMCRVNEEETHAVTAPLWQQAFDWFLEEHNLWHMVYPRDGWNFAIQKIDSTPSCTEESYHSTEINLYQEAQLACLDKLIEIVEQQKNKL